ncbi:MAG: phosphoglucosamine mutase [bacterium]
MSEDSLFGTDGIRGEANSSPLVPGTLTRVGRALGTYWRRESSSRKVIVGHDGRQSETLVRTALVSGLVSTGIDVQELGFCSTPALSYLARNKRVAGGIMISASHNPFYDNGLKPLTGRGEKFRVADEEQVMDLFRQQDFKRAKREEIGQVFPRESWISDYIEALSSRLMDFPGHVVVDCSNGGTARIASAVLGGHCDELTVINDEPDGRNINKNAGSLHPQVVADRVKEENADLGFALDGDGDRVVAIDEDGTPTNGDVLMYLLASTFKQEGTLDGNGLVMTSMSNLGLRLALEEAGIDYEVVGVGDRLVFQKLDEVDWRIGGEQSGHVIDRDWLPTGDGLNTVVTVINSLIKSAKPLSYWIDEVKMFPQILHNIDVDRKPPLEELSETQEKIETVENELGRKGRVLVRYSGTEPVARIMLEGQDQERLNSLAADIGETMKKELQQTGD